MIIKRFMLGLAVCSLSLGIATAEEAKVSIDQLPAAVMAALENTCPGGVIQEIEMEIDDGELVYEVEVEIGDKECDLTITAEGTIKETAQEMSMDEVPVAVQKTLALFVNANVKEIEQVQEDGKVVYECEMKMGKRSFEVEISPDGHILELESRQGKGGDDDDDHDEGEQDDD